MFCPPKLYSQPFWIILLSLLGFLSLTKNTIFLLKWIFITFFRKPKNLKNYGSWALITGSTDGIGKAFSFQLAKQGLNLILVSRNLSKLKNVSIEIQEKYPNTLIKIFEIDFSGPKVSARILEMKEETKGLDVGALINNVGVTYPSAMLFHEVDEEIWMNLVRVNVEGTTLIARSIMEEMVLRKKGAVVNIGSGASIVVPSHPLYAIYGATKAYIDQLSRCLYVEYKQYGIDVQCQVPLYVSTNMASKVASIEKPSVFIPSAERYAASAVESIGYEARCTPYWGHSIQWWVASFFPDVVLDTWRLFIGIQRRKSGLVERIPRSSSVVHELLLAKSCVKLASIPLINWVVVAIPTQRGTVASRIA